MTIHKDVQLTDWLEYPRAVVRELDALYPSLLFSTYPGHDPHENRACDIFPNAAYASAAGIAEGTAFAEWIWANRYRYNIWYEIWRARIRSMSNPGAGWQTYRPSAAAIRKSPDSAYHRNHVHFSVYASEPWTSVWLDRLTPGVTNSESVAFVQRALKIPETGDYDDPTASAVRVFQRAVLGDAPEYADGNLGKWQAAELLKRSGQRAILRPEPSGAPAPTVTPDAPVTEPEPPIVVTDPKPPEPPEPAPASAVSPAELAVAARTLVNVELAAEAATRTGCPWWLLCAVLEKESRGRNIYGHDRGGALSDSSGKDIPVTEENWREFRELVLVKGKTSNGVGPMQITWKGFFTDMESRGLKPWDPADNLLYGAELLAKYWRAAASYPTTDQRVARVGRLYNGADAYGRALASVASAWRDRLASATAGPEYPLPDSGEVYLDKLTPGVTDSDSVAYVQTWLDKVLPVDVPRTGDYDAATVGVVKSYQRDTLGDDPEHADGDLGQLQTIALAKAADAEVTIYADSKEGGQVWPEPPPPPPPPAKPDTEDKPEPEPSGPVIVRVLGVNVQDKNLASSQDDPWNERRGALFAAAKSTRPDVAIIQEATEPQVRELCAALGSSWVAVEYGPPGRYGPNAIAYNSAKVKCGKVRGKDLPSNRGAIAAELTIGGKTFTAVGSHLDNNGGRDQGPTRISQAKILTEWLPGEVTKTERSPLIFAADLNDSRTGGTGPRAEMRKAGVVFIRDIPGLAVAGREYESHHGYATLSKDGKWIDDMGVRGVKRVRSAGLVRTDKGAPNKVHRNGTDHCLPWAEIEL